MEGEPRLEYTTDVARWIGRLIPYDEEENPLVERPSPGMLVARVAERIVEGLWALDCYYTDEDAEADYDAECEQPGLVRVGIAFIGAAVFAISAIPHVYREVDMQYVTKVKDELLDYLDDRVDIWISGEEEPWEDADPDLWARLVPAMMAEPFRLVCQLEQFTTRDPEEVSANVREELPDALMEVAVAAAAAGQWLIERHEEVTGARLGGRSAQDQSSSASSCSP